MDTVKFKFELGCKARCRVTNIVGTIDARSEWLNGCIRYSIQAMKTDPKSDKIPESYWVDEGQVEKVDDGLNANPVKLSRTGGPSTPSSNARG